MVDRCRAAEPQKAGKGTAALGIFPCAAAPFYFCLAFVFRITLAAYTPHSVEGCKSFFNFPEESFSRFFRGSYDKDKIYKNVRRNRSDGLFGFAFREDDHRDAAVEDGGADVVDPLRPPACADRWGRPTARWRVRPAWGSPASAMCFCRTAGRIFVQGESF